MVGTLELDTQRAITVAYIATQPAVVTLIPRAKVNTANGVSFTAGTPRAPQTVRMNEPGDSGRRTPIGTNDGIQRDVDYVLLGEYDAVVANNDVLVYRGQEYVVIQVMTPNDYEVRAMVVRHGW